MAPVFMNLHVKCLLFLAKNDDAENHLLCCNDWMNSQDIVKDEQCGKFCLTRCYYLPFGIQNLCEVVENAKCVLAKEKLDI